MPVFPVAIELDYITVLKHVKPPQPGATTLWWMLAAFLGATLLFALLGIISRYIRISREMKRSEDNFNQLALVCQLTPEEIKLLRSLVGVCGIRYPDRLFTSFEFFNRCLEDKGPGASGALSESDMKRFRIIRNKVFFGERSRIPPIKTTHELRSNQWLHLKRIANGKVFMARVVEAGASGLLVATPRIKGTYLEIRGGERFDIYFWRDRDASYHFESEVIGQSGIRSLITIFKHVEDVERIQRRQYHRIDTSIPVVAIPVTRDELNRISQNETIVERGHPGLPAYVVNISGAGFALVARVSLKPSDLVYIELPADGADSTIPVIGRILGVTERKTTGEFLLHAEFAGLSADTHERIFQTIYSQAKQESQLPV
ncbi:MAG: PilZ domain-containing protein [Candidatus Hydrogenedentota bacterium]|nr:MAG: PilZ domain-containing protein [Candidatus Hydrogenedentota bacterium]